MAQSKSFFGIRRGQAMGMVFSKGQNGSGKAIQITRALPESVKNPRTSAQMEQRALMAAAMKSYAMLKTLADHSMQGKTYGQQSMSEFLRVNYAAAKAALPSAIGFPFYGSEYDTVFQGTVLSKGQLDEPEVMAKSNSQTIEIDLADYATEKELVSALGLKNVGDVYTVALIVGNFESVGEVGDSSLHYIQQKQLAYSRLKLLRLPNDEAPTGDTFETLFDTADSANITLAIDNGIIELSTREAIGGFGEESQIQLIAEVASQKTDGGWLRSTSLFRLYADPTDSVVRNELTKMEALSTYPVGAEKILNGAGMTRAAAAVVRVGAYQITSAGSPMRGEWYLGVEVNGSPHIVADNVTLDPNETQGQAVASCIKLGDTIDNANLSFNPSPLSPASEFTLAAEVGITNDEGRNAISVAELKSYIAAGSVENLPIGTVSPVAASTLPVINAIA